MTAPAAARRSRPARPVAAAVLAGLMVIVLAIAAVEGAMTHKFALRSLGPTASLLTIILVIAAVGLVVATHQPRNPVGWLMAGVALLLSLNLAGSGYTTAVYHDGHHGLPLVGPVALLLAELFPIAFLPFPLVILLFPDGRLPSRRWRWVLWAYVAVGAAALLSAWGASVSVIAGHRIRVLADGELAQLGNLSGSAAWLGPVLNVFLGSVVLLWLAALARQIGSWRGSSGERRQQLKWLMSGAAVCVVGVGAIATNSALWEVLILAFAALPVGIGIGILKYRLYEIDRIISRTLAYAIVTGLLVGVYAGLVLLATHVLSFKTPVAVAASTLAAAALFAPVRRWVQRIVDRRFNRARYDADQTIAAFAARLQGAVDLNTVRDDLTGVSHAALEPAHVSLWIVGGSP